MPTLISHGYPGAMSKDVATRRLLQKEMRETMAFHATDRIAGAFSSECRLGVVEHGVIPQMFAFDGECKAELSILGSTSFFLGGREELNIYISGNMHHAMILTCWGNLNDLHPEVRKSPSKNIARTGHPSSFHFKVENPDSAWLQV